MATSSEQLLVQIDATTEQLRREMRRADQTVNRSGRQIDRRLQNIDRSFATAQRAAVRFAGALGLGLSVQALQNFVGSALRAAEGIADLNQQTGIGTDLIQGFRQRADQTGSSVGAADDAMRRFSRRMGLFASTEGGAAAGAFERLDIAVRNADGSMRDTEAVFRDVVDAISRLSSEAEQSAVASEFFGETAGPSLAASLREGQRGIDETTDKLRDAGRLLGEDTVDSAGKASAAMRDLFATFRDGVTAGFLDQFVGQIEDLDNIAGSDMASNISEISTAIGGLFGSITQQGLSELATLAAITSVLRGDGSIDDLDRILGGSTLGLLGIEPNFAGVARSSAGGAIAGAAFGSEPSVTQADMTSAGMQFPVFQPSPFFDRFRRPEPPEAPFMISPPTPGDRASPLSAIEQLREDADRRRRQAEEARTSASSSGTDERIREMERERDAAEGTLGEITRLFQQHTETRLQTVRRETSERMAELDRLRDQSIITEEEHSQARIELITATSRQIREIQEREAREGARAQINAQREVERTIESTMRSISSGLTSALYEGENAWDSFGNTAVNVLQRVHEQVMELVVIAPLMNSLFGGNRTTIGDVGGIIGGLFGGGGSGGATHWTGAQIAHSGGVPGTDSLPGRSVPSALFNGAQRFHGGLMPDEFPAILQKGEGVFTRGQMAAMGGGPVTVNVINQGGEPLQVESQRQRPGAGGGKQIDVFVRQIVQKEMGNGAFDEQLSRRFGLSRMGQR